MEEILYVPSRKFLTFDPDGSITSISNTKPASDNFIEVDYSKVSKLLAGEESTFSYEIVFNTLKRCYELNKKVEEKEKAYSFKDDFFEIQRKNTIFDIKITQDNLKKLWIIDIDYDLAETLIEKSLYNGNRLFFSITDVNNPFILHQFITIDFYNLLKNKKIIEEFNENIFLDANYSIYTKRMLENYSYEVINE